MCGSKHPQGWPSADIKQTPTSLIAAKTEEAEGKDWINLSS